VCVSGQHYVPEYLALSSGAAAPPSTAFAAESRSGTAILTTYLPTHLPSEVSIPIPETRLVRRNLLAFRIQTALNDLPNSGEVFHVTSSFLLST
jgi:hypothetical protein